MGSTWAEGFWFGWFYVANWGLVFWVQGASREGCHFGNLGMIACVVVLYWLRVCDYFFCYFVSYQQTVFIYSSFVWMRFSNCFVYNCLCALSWDKKMLIVISGFACIYKCIYFKILFSIYYYSFVSNRGKYVLRCFP